MAREYAPAEVFSNKTNEQIFAPLPSMQSERTGGILYVVLFQYTDKRLGGNVSKLLKWLSMNCGIKSVQRKMLNYFCDVFLTHSSTLAWKIPWTEEPGGLQSMGSQRVGHHRATSQLHSHIFINQNRNHYNPPILLQCHFT